MSAASLRERYGPVALVTGASSGIGEQFARLLAREGFNLLITARREDALQALREQLQREHQVTVNCVVCDLCDLSQVDRLIAQARQADIGLVVSNAGYGVRKGPYLDVSQSQLEAMYQANSIAPARIIRALLPALVQRGRGGILCTGSIEGDAVFPYSTGYAASKAFIHSLVLGLWYELRGTGVDVLLLAPGSTDTQAPMAQGISREQLVGLMSPAEVARQALHHLGRQPHFTPGIHNRLFVGLLRLLPRKLAIRLAGSGMRQAIDKSSRA